MEGVSKEEGIDSVPTVADPKITDVEGSPGRIEGHLISSNGNENSRTPKKVRILYF